VTPPPSDALRALAAGAVQGPAEILPVSSSAHVELLAGRLGLGGEARKELAVAVHAGSAVALLAAGVRPRSAAQAVLSVGPPSAAGLALERLVERRLGTPAAMAAGLAAGSLALVAADRRHGARPARAAGAADALALGAAQACALWPGVSRSGAVLAAARARGFSRPAAWTLARETAVPVLVAASALKGARALRRGADLRALACGAGAAALSTAAALRAGPRAERLPAAGWAAYRCAVAGAVLAVRETWGR
jgi:undecaprenyl-diphosphatase